MAWAVDQTSLGVEVDTNYGGARTYTTDAAVASGAWIFVGIMWGASATLSSVSGGGLTWNIQQQQYTGGETKHTALCYAYAPSGLASSTVISFTMSSGDHGGWKAGASSFTGGDASSVDAVDVATGGSGTAWTTDSITTAEANELIVVAASADIFEGASSAPTSPSVELIDNSATTAHIVLQYRQATTATSYTSAGTWSSAGVWGTAAVAMKEAAGAAATVIPQPTKATPRDNYKDPRKSRVSGSPIPEASFPAPPVAKAANRKNFKDTRKSKIYQVVADVVVTPEEIPPVVSAVDRKPAPITRVSHVVGPLGVASEQSATIEQTSETDTAQAVTWKKIRLVGQASETDTSQTHTHKKTVTLGLSSETETAQPIQVVAHAIAIGQPEETDLSRPISWNPKHRIAGLSSETDSAQAITWAPKKRIIGQASETDTAQSVTPPSLPRFAIVSWAEFTSPAGFADDSLGRATETDTAQPITAEKTLAVGRTYEQYALYPGDNRYPGEVFPLGDSGALPINATKSFAVGQATEVDTAGDIESSETVGQPVETDEANAIRAIRVYTLGQASETDEATAVGGAALRYAIVSWAEFTAPAGAPSTSIGQATTTEQALAVTVVQPAQARVAAAGLIFMWGDPPASGHLITLGQATETETAQAVTSRYTLAIGQASETDTAQVVSAVQFFPVGQASETDTARPITAVGGGIPVPVGQSLETDEAQPLTIKLVRLVGLALESDEAIELEIIGGRNLRALSCDDLDMIPEGGPFGGFDPLYPSASTFPAEDTYPSEGADPLLGEMMPENTDDLTLEPA